MFTELFVNIACNYSLSIFAGIRLLHGSSVRFVSNAIKSRHYSQKMDAKLEAIPLVDIDDEGRFKYILIKVYGREQADGTEPTKLIVRGYKRAQWHGNEKTLLVYVLNVWNKSIVLKELSMIIKLYILFAAADIYDEVSGSVRALGLDTECLGGGRIEHFPENKLLKVYGYSTVSCHPVQIIFHFFHLL